MADPTVDLDMLLQVLDSNTPLSAGVLGPVSEPHFSSQHPRLSINTNPEEDDFRRLFAMPHIMEAVPEDAITNDEVLCAFSDQAMVENVANGAHQHSHIAPVGSEMPSSFRVRPNRQSSLELNSYPEELGPFLEQQQYSESWPSAHGVSNDPCWFEGHEEVANLRNMHWLFETPSRSHSSLFGSRLFPQERKTSSAADITGERFAKMAKLWSRKSERPWQLIQTLWSDVVDCPGSNIFSTSNDPHSVGTLIGALGRVDDAKRLSLIKEYGVSAASMVTFHGLVFKLTVG